MRIYSSEPTPPQPPEGDPPADLRERIVYELKRIFDPEIPISIYELGLIYKIDIDEPTGAVKIDMTLTTPNCPEAQVLPGEVRRGVMTIPQVKSCDVQIVWDPPWNKDLMSDAAKLHLGLM
ncbi:MAG: DUF59 domain-containing protein [Planctomycetes bacterium]|nr:DUF59 domain-containing protein [Planctomycetota bacterium]